MKELAIVIFMEGIEARTEEPTDNFAITAQFTDSSRLTEVQKRLIRANIVRRNRIIFATRSMKAAKQPKLQQSQVGIILVLNTIEQLHQLPN